MRRRPTPPMRCSDRYRPTGVARCWRSRCKGATGSTSISKALTKLSSSRSDALFGGIYARGGTSAETDDRAWLQAMLDVEAALARACALEELIPAGVAETIVEACIAEHFDLAAIERGTALAATPVIALVAALRDAVGGQASQYVHLGATSPDIVVAPL